MALISCPECGKQISETTPSCPHCGYQLSTQVSMQSPAASVPAPTEIGALKQRIAGGTLEILFGIVIVLVSIPFIGVFGLGIFSMIAGIVLIGHGFMGVTGTHTVTCPHCGKTAELGRNTDSFKCPTCKKRSVRNGNHLDPVQ